LFFDPVDTPDGYLSQLESTVTAILDEVALLPGGRKAAKQWSLCRGVEGLNPLTRFENI